MICSELSLSIALALALVANPPGEAPYQKAIEKIGAAEYGEAITLLRSAVRSLRGDALAAARFELARVDTDPVQAAFELQNLLAAAPEAKKPPLALALGELHLLLGDPASAAAVLAEVRRGPAKDPVVERASYLWALALLRANKHEEARAAWSDHLIDYLEGEWQVAARVGIAVANERLGRPRESIEIYKAVLAQHPGAEEEPWVLSRLAALLADGDPQEARRYRDRLTKEYPLHATEATPTAAIPAAEPPRRPAPPVTSAPQGRFLIQAGVFRDPANAENLRARLAGAGLPGLVTPRGEFHAVVVGPFADQEKAAAILSRVEEVIGEKPRIIRRTD